MCAAVSQEYGRVGGLGKEGTGSGRLGDALYVFCSRGSPEGVHSFGFKLLNFSS